VENFHSLLRRNTTSNINNAETLKRYAFFVDHEKHQNRYISELIKPSNRHLNTVAHLDDKIKKSSIYLLKFFKEFLEKQDLSKDTGSAKNSKFMIPPIKEGFPPVVRPCGYFSKNPPDLRKACDFRDCNVDDVNIEVLNCGHSYHIICLNDNDGSCIYCMDYFSSKINELTLSYNERLSSDIELEEEIDVENEEGEDDVDYEDNHVVIDNNGNEYENALNNLRLVAANYNNNNNNSDNLSPAIDDNFISNYTISSNRSDSSNNNNSSSRNSSSNVSKRKRDSFIFYNPNKKTK
jgi:hypothetical protein